MKTAKEQDFENRFFSLARAGFLPGTVYQEYGALRRDNVPVAKAVVEALTEPCWVEATAEEPAGYGRRPVRVSDHLVGVRDALLRDCADHSALSDEVEAAERRAGWDPNP